MNNNLLAIPGGGDNLGDIYFGGLHPLKNLLGVGSLVSAGVSNAIMVAGVVLVIVIIYSGISMIGASGNAQQFTRARMVLTSAIIGFVIVVAAWLIVKAIETSTEVPILG